MSGQWREYTHADGRKYWSNGEKSEWGKPLEAMSPAERAAIQSQPWREHTAASGRKYYSHSTTRETRWDMPDEYRNAMAQHLNTSAQPVASAPPQYVAGSGISVPEPVPQRRNREDRQQGEQRGNHYGHNDGYRNSYVSSSAFSNFASSTSTNEPEYSSHASAEAAFLKLLKRSGVEPDWTWEDTVRAVSQDSQYRALKDPKERKAAFEKYVVEARQQQKEREQERLAQLKEDFGRMLKSHPEIKHYTKWQTAHPIIQGETIFRSARDDTEAQQLFEEYIANLKKAKAQHEVSQRSSALNELSSLLRSLEIEPHTQWNEAKGMIESNPRVQNDAKFQFLHTSDILTTFESHVKALAREHNDARQREKGQKSRQERKRREAFISLLGELIASGKIKAGTKWKNVLPLLEEDERYTSLLGQPGSNPLELFWDTVEEAERSLRDKRNKVLDVIDDKRLEITPTTTVDEFLSVVEGDGRVAHVDVGELRLIFERLHAKVIRRTEEDKHHAERAQRRAIDNLRSRIKRLDPPVRATDEWERDVRPRVENTSDFRAIETEEARKSAFEKVVRRLKEKEVDDEANGRRTNGRRSRGGDGYEYDPYEADRKQASADRVNSYRKTSVYGLSPPPPDGHARRPDRYDPLDYHGPDGRRPRRLSQGRERFDRHERGMYPERNYPSRADPRERGAAELDYGENAGSMSGSAGASRRRRSSYEDDESVRGDAKRLKRDSRTQTPANENAAPKDDPGYKSGGSEEGEIEET